ncbi:hypothetical protein OSC52_03825 [Clostridium pasteurianum]|uniref:hypothetical protein n=1 Tax=Clostridium pasteurianum TaxID=1501 RepID=UPI0022609361|nr:hypothetical protein [Clostridium pasteurianum]UZW14984.1 hypothetical protein OSC52_03825 [Clostridium pasteurianum]
MESSRTSPPIERNASYIDLKLIGATEITTDFQSVIDAYPYSETINSDKFTEFLQRLISINEGKKVFVILDNEQYINLVQYKILKLEILKI